MRVRANCWGFGVEAFRKDYSWLVEGGEWGH